MESKREKVLLVGNGINRIGNQTVSWEDLLNNLKRHIHSGRNVDLSNEFKPFPLAFEEIVFYKLRPYEESTKVLKDSIAETITRLAPNDVHKQIMECRIKHIMTTNYDYSLEKALNPSFKMNDRNLTSTNEEKHSIFRKYKLKDKTIWHLHGESKDDKYKNAKVFYASQSILIGFEQYSKYLSKIQDYCYGKTSYAKSLVKRLEAYQNDPLRGFDVKSWIDLIFVYDVVILGLSLDFSETHLWWLLNYRQENFRYNNDRKHLINNKIRYYYCDVPDPESTDLNQIASRISKRKKKEAIVDVLKSLGVDCVKVALNSYDEMPHLYNGALQKERLIY